MRKSEVVGLRPRSRFHTLAAACIVAGLVGFGYVATHIFAAAGTQLYLTPASGSYSAGSTVAVQVMLNTGGEGINAVQADFTYPTSRLQFQSIDPAGSAFDIDASSSGGGGAVSISRGKIGSVTGTVLVATVRFSVLSSAGSAALAFQNSSAAVRSSDNQNALASTAGAAYTVAVPTPTPVPTATPTPKPGSATPTPKPGTTATPKPGTATPTPATSSATPTPTSSSTPVAGPAGPSPTVSTKPQATSTTPASSSGLFNFRQPSTLVLSMTAAGSGVLVLIGLLAWLASRSRRRLADLSAPGSSRVYEPPSTPGAAMPTVAPAAMPPTPAAPAPQQTFYPGDQQPPTPPPGGPAV